jgi:hypothetical protein
MLLRSASGFLPCCFAAVFCIIFTGLAPAQQKTQSNSTAEAQERTALAEKFATERLAIWRQRLDLEDWNISVVLSHPSDLKPRTLGNIHWDNDKKTAVIRVLDPSDYKMSFDDILKDIEFTVVHELIHLELSPVLSPLQRNDANRREEEHAVNHMADALLKLDRASRSAKASAPPTTESKPAQAAAAAPSHER